MAEPDVRRAFFRKLGLSEFCVKLTKEHAIALMVVYADSPEAAASFAQDCEPEAHIEVMATREHHPENNGR